MKHAFLLSHLLDLSAAREPSRIAIKYGGAGLSYGELGGRVRAFASAVIELGVARGERVAIYLEKRFETVVSAFGVAAAGCVFVPINPLLKPDQVAYILRDCNVRLLVTSGDRLDQLNAALKTSPDLRAVVVVDDDPQTTLAAGTHRWQDLEHTQLRSPHRVIDDDTVAILYTSGSTGRPKGVVLSHRNMVAGACSVAQYLDNTAEDVLLALLPLSFDAGFSQLTTAFSAGACVVLHNYLLSRDAVRALDQERITGLTAVPPLWIQLSQQVWPDTVQHRLRYIANTGGKMPLELLRQLRSLAPKTKVYLMYGLTEAFRSTYLTPEEMDRRPESIGKAIPNAEILVLREDGTPCAANEPGELVHRGALVAQGYWNDAEKTAERFKPLLNRETGLMLPEIAVFSGDTVRADEDGFLYFVGRRDEMIKSSGYRVSPTEIEEVLYGLDGIAEAVAFGIPHPSLGQAIVAVVAPKNADHVDEGALIGACRERLPAYMVPARIVVRPAPLARNANGKLDRKSLSSEFVHLFTEQQ